MKLIKTIGSAQREKTAQEFAQKLNGLSFVDAKKILDLTLEQITGSLRIDIPTDESQPDEETCKKWKRVMEATCPQPLLIELQKLAPYLKLDVSGKLNHAHL